MYTLRLNGAVKGNRAVLLLLPHSVIDSVKVGPPRGLWSSCSIRALVGGGWCAERMHDEEGLGGAPIAVQSMSILMAR